MALLTYLLLGAACLLGASAKDAEAEVDACSCWVESLDPSVVCYDSYKSITYSELSPEFSFFDNNLPCHRRSFPPQSPSDVGTTFRLYTRSNKASPRVITKSSFSSYFSPSRQTKFIIHGFTDQGTSEWILTMKDELLAKGDFNVIGVDWKDGASPGFVPDYCIAVQNTRVVGRQIAELVRAMDSSSSQFKRSNVHIIGHSLGGQIAGYAGQALAPSGKIGRISGMDPAGPLYHEQYDDCRLDPSDADFVDASHTSYFGIFQPVGDVDFYPNLGGHMPGCTYAPIFEGTCGHSKAIEYFTDSINNLCTHAYPCSWSFGDGQGCTYSGSGKQSVAFGYQVSTGTRGNFVHMTNENSPYCNSNLRP